MFKIKKKLYTAMPMMPLSNSRSKAAKHMQIYYQMKASTQA